MLGWLLKVLDPEPVVVDQPNCLRVRHARSACRACSDLCPAQAIGFAERRLTVDPVLCTRCGLCMGACPTVALQVRGIDESALDSATKVRCTRADGDGVLLPCLGVLSADQMVDLGSLHPGLLLSAGDCSRCQLSIGGQKAMATMASANETLQALGLTEPIRWDTIAVGAGATSPHTVSRRDLLRLWSSSAVQSGRTLLPDRQVNPISLPTRVPRRRVRWLTRVSVPKHDNHMVWPTRQVSANCTGCNICVHFCPTGALASEHKDGRWAMTFQAAACVDCRTCTGLCPTDAITPGETPRVDEVVGGLCRSVAEMPKRDPDQPGKSGTGISLNDLGALR